MKETKGLYKLDTKQWYIERIVYLMAGIFVFGSVLLGMYVNETFFLFTLLVGAMLINFAFTGYCPMSILLGKIGVQRKI